MEQTMQKEKMQGMEELNLNLCLGSSSHCPEKKKKRSRSPVQSPEPIRAVLQRELVDNALGYYLDDIHTHLTHIEQCLQWQTSVILTTTNRKNLGLHRPSLFRPYRYWTGRVFLNPPQPVYHQPPPPPYQNPPIPYPHFSPQPYPPSQPPPPHQPCMSPNFPTYHSPHPQPTLPPPPSIHRPSAQPPQQEATSRKLQKSHSEKHSSRKPLE